MSTRRGVQLVIADERRILWDEVSLSDDQIPPGQLLVRNLLTAPSLGTELAVYTGRDPRARQPGEWCAYPFRAGTIAVSEVLAVGDHAAFAPGDLVFCHSPHASVAYVDPDAFLCLRLDGALPLEQAVLLRHATIALTAVLVSRNRGAGRVLLAGLGLVGSLASQLFATGQTTVVAAEPRAARRKAATSVGIETVASLDDHALIEARLGGPPTTAVDAVGDPRVVSTLIELVAARGEVILLGTPHDDLLLNLTPLLRRIHFDWITVTGALEWLFPIYPDGSGAPSFLDNTRTMLEQLQQGMLRTDGLVQTIDVEPGADPYDQMLELADEVPGFRLDWRHLDVP